MSRIDKYQESISKFVKDHSFISTWTNIKMKKMLLDIYSKRDQFPSIIFLTITNHLSRINKSNLPCYHGASGIDFADIGCNILLHRSKPSYLLLSSSLLMATYQSFNLNFDDLGVYLNESDILSLRKTMFDFLFSRLGPNGLLDSTYNLRSECLDVTKADKEDLIERFPYLKSSIEKIETVTKKQWLSIVESTYGIIFESCFGCSWILGMGDKNKMDTVCDIGKKFGGLYQISNDFVSLIDTIQTKSDIISFNIVVTIGVQRSYELFLSYKESVIKKLLEEDLFSGTMKEIIDVFQDRIDDVISESEGSEIRPKENL
jgi:hypothetical protein